MVVGSLQIDGICVEGTGTIIADGVKTKVLKGVLVPMDNTLAGLNDILDEHGYRADRHDEDVEEVDDG